MLLEDLKYLIRHIIKETLEEAEFILTPDVKSLINAIKDNNVVANEIRQTDDIDEIEDILRRDRLLSTQFGDSIEAAAQVIAVSKMIGNDLLTLNEAVEEEKGYSGPKKYKKVVGSGKKKRTVRYGAKGYKIAPGTSKGDSYCARSYGQMKDHPSAAKDANSPLRLSRKKWRCSGKYSRK
jgi:hypothetical protein